MMLIGFIEISGANYCALGGKRPRVRSRSGRVKDGDLAASCASAPEAGWSRQGVEAGPGGLSDKGLSSLDGK
jgi:hypothetical protein